MYDFSSGNMPRAARSFRRAFSSSRLGRIQREGERQRKKRARPPRHATVRAAFWGDKEKYHITFTSKQDMLLWRAVCGIQCKTERTKTFCAPAFFRTRAHSLALAPEVTISSTRRTVSPCKSLAQEKAPATFFLRFSLDR